MSTHVPISAPFPALFIGHGSPMNALEENANSRAWRECGQRLPRPRAILVISAHWETQGLSVTAAHSPRTLHDFTGFPERLNAFRYPAPGSPFLVRQLARLVAPETLVLHATRGLDHGVWSVLARLYPGAHIPVVQLSLDTTRNAAAHYALARHLRTLRDERVLILGSGNIVHNLKRMDWHRQEGGYSWAERFRNRVRRLLRDQEHAQLCRLDDEDALFAVPTPEHYLPLLYVAAVQDEGEPLTPFNDRIEYGSISMLSAWVGHMPPLP